MLRDLMRETRTTITPFVIDVPFVPFANPGSSPAFAPKVNAPVAKARKGRPVAARAIAVAPEHQQGVVSNDRSRMFISLGNYDNIKPNQMVELICAHTNIPAKDIGHISICDQYSFFDLPQKYAKKVITDMSGVRHNKRTIQVEVSTKK